MRINYHTLKMCHREERDSYPDSLYAPTALSLVGSTASNRKTTRDSRFIFDFVPLGRTFVCSKFALTLWV